MATMSKAVNRRNGAVIVTRLTNSAQPINTENATTKSRPIKTSSSARSTNNFRILSLDRNKFLTRTNSKDDVINNTNEKDFTHPKPFLHESSTHVPPLPTTSDSRVSKSSRLLRRKKTSGEARSPPRGKSAVERTLTSASSRGSDGHSVGRRFSISTNDESFTYGGSLAGHRIRHVTINMIEDGDPVLKPVSRPSTPTRTTPAEEEEDEVTTQDNEFLYSDDEDDKARYDVLLDPHGDGTAMVYRAACRQMRIIPSTTFERCYFSNSAMLNYQGLTSKGTRAVCLALVSNAVVTELSLAGNAIGTYGLRCIVGMLKHNVNIKQLDVSDNDLKSAGALLLADLLKNDSLVTLKASGNHFKETDAIYFSEALQKNTSLKHLDLSHNEFTEKGGILLGRGLGDNESLESVDLSWNHLRLSGITGIADGIKVNVSIKRLNVSWNGIGNDGARILGRALKENRVLTELDVSSSRIGFDGLGMLLSGMAGNETLRCLSLTKNPITSSGACVVLKFILSTPSLQIEKIEMADLCVSSEFLDLLSEVKKLRPDFVAVYGGLLRTRDMWLEDLAMRRRRDIRDPMEILMEYVKQNNLRLMDMFTRLDKDKNCSISRVEFERGIRDANIPLDNLQLDRLINRLDHNGDGEIDFGELLDGFHKFTQRQRQKRKNSARDVQSANQNDGSRNTSPTSDYNPNSRPATPYCINLSGPLGNKGEFIMSMKHLPSNKNTFLNVSDINIPMSISNTDEDTSCEILVPQLLWD